MAKRFLKVSQKQTKWTKKTKNGRLAATKGAKKKPKSSQKVAKKCPKVTKRHRSILKAAKSWSKSFQSQSQSGNNNNNMSCAKKWLNVAKSLPKVGQHSKSGQKY